MGGKMKATKCLILCLVLLCGAMVLRAQTPQWQWAVKAGGDYSDVGYSIAIDSQGNQYIIGCFEETATFGTHTLTASGDDDLFVAKLDPSGNWLWAVRAGGAGRDVGRGIAVDVTGNAYVTGYYTGTATFGNHTLTTYGGELDTDIYVAKLDTNGNWLWVVQAGSTNFDWGNSIALDGMGYAYVTGHFFGNATFGSHSLTANGGTDIFVVKLSPSGNWLQAVQAGGADFEEAYCIAVDEAGNTWLTGVFRDTTTFGNRTLTTNGNNDIFVAKLGFSGNWLWAVNAGGTNYDFGYDIAVDDEGNAWVTGFFMGAASFGSHSVVAGGSGWNANIFVARLDPSGNWLWAVNAGGTGTDHGNGIAMDGTGNAYVTGRFQGTATFGSHTLTTYWDTDIFVARLDPSGNWLWAVKAGGTDADFGNGISVDGSGNPYVTGSFEEVGVFDNIHLIASGGTDIYVAKLGICTAVEDELAPQAVAGMHNAYPNPLNRDGSALIKAEIPERTTGTLSIFNLRGQVVARHKLGSGLQQISFSGVGLPAGVYFYSLQCGEYRETRKLVLLK